MARDQIIDMIAVWDRRMPAIRTMLVIRDVRPASVPSRALRRIRRRHRERVLIDVIPMLVMQMPVMKIIDVPLVPHRHMTAIAAMHVRVPFVNLASHQPSIYHTCTVAQVYNRSVNGRLLLIGDYQ